jgi:hypothetical protein
MPLPKVEDVFKINGVPTYTFVRPKEYNQLMVSLRTPGRGLVLEGPSGVGKTTAVESLLAELNLSGSVTKLSARKNDDLEYIRDLPELGRVGTILIDDFHKLDDASKGKIADYLKVLADEESRGAKLVILGINRAGERLVELAGDLVNRIDIVRFESNSDNKVEELVSKGERTLNITLNIKQEIVEASQGSFYIAQLLSHYACLSADVTEKQDTERTTEISFELVRATVWDRLAVKFDKTCKIFCRGPRMRSYGRAPYMHLLRWLASGREWTLSITDAIVKHPEVSGSVTQIAEKGYLAKFISDHPELQEVLYFDEAAKTLTVDDRQFVFFVRNISWNSFAKAIGFSDLNFTSKYDFALSFAGPDRPVAEALFKRLREEELEVFYDKNEEHRILARDVEEYLRPIYQSEAAFVICVLGPEYPNRIWTKVESEAFKGRFGTEQVIPIWLDSAPPTMFDKTRWIGAIKFATKDPIEPQVDRIVELLKKRLAEHRMPTTALV